MSIIILKIKDSLVDFFKLTLPLLPVFYLLRLYEFVTAGVKLTMVTNYVWFELLAIIYTTWTWLLLCAIVVIPFILIFLLHKKSGIIFTKTICTIAIVLFFSIVVVFSERLVPFDHEIFMRAPADMILTVNANVVNNFYKLFVLSAYISLYFVFYKFVIKKRQIKQVIIYIFLGFLLLSAAFAKYSSPSRNSFSHMQEFNYTVNKLHYFTVDCLEFFYNTSNYDFGSAGKDEILEQIELYQKLHKFKYVGKEYPLLHLDESKNVLGNFFNVSDTMPNIVIIIYEGLTRDFSGPDGEAGSFTPFLDSLSDQGLSWYNSLSHAACTFGSMPSITGSLPFGRKGFTFESKPADHLSLIKIFKKNNFQVNYFIGGSANFDNFAGYFRREGGDYVSARFPSKYKEMGIGPEGYSEGYPDNALFNFSFDVMDSIKFQPYFNIYLTLSTHDPYIFDELPVYQKKFDRLLIKRNLPESKIKKLRPFRTILASYLFADDCMHEFFNKYKKRKDFKNTIFVIVGDHHNGSYPARNMIDDYNVPLVIYSPMLKKPVRFQSVNSHFNIAPSLVALLRDSYHLKYYPRYVSWLGDELDTCRTFRNIHDVPFIMMNRNIEDYLYKETYVAGDQYFRLKEHLNLDETTDPDTIKKMNMIINNFRFINSYVCTNNKLYPENEDIFENKEILLSTFNRNKEFELNKLGDNEDIDTGYCVPLNAKRVKVKVSFSGQIADKDFSKLPMIAICINSAENDTTYFWSGKEMSELYKMPAKNETWGTYADEDIFDMDNYKDTNGHAIKVQFFNARKIKMKIKDFKIEFYNVQ